MGLVNERSLRKNAYLAILPQLVITRTVFRASMPTPAHAMVWHVGSLTRKSTLDSVEQPEPIISLMRKKPLCGAMHDPANEPPETRMLETATRGGESEKQQRMKPTREAIVSTTTPSN
jgi:hypothetical protein